MSLAQDCVRELVCVASWLRMCMILGGTFYCNSVGLHSVTINKLHIYHTSTYSGSSFESCKLMLWDLEVICGLVRYPASPLRCSRPAQGGVRELIMFLSPTVSLTDNEWAT